HGITHKTPVAALTTTGVSFLRLPAESLDRHAPRAFGADHDDGIPRQQENRSFRRAPTCGVPENYAKSWEGLHHAKFLPGYVDYRGEADGTEDGYVIMSFGLPSSLTQDRKSTRLNSSHEWISYAVFCLKKKTNIEIIR